MVKKKKSKEATTESLGLDWTDNTDYEAHGLQINDPVITPMSESEEKRGPGQPKKYTLEWCRAEVQSMLSYLTTPLEDKEQEVQRRSVLFISELCIRGGYAPQRWSEWKSAYAKDEEFSEATKMVESILETRLVKAGLGGKANPILTIFALKTKYGWREQEPQVQPPNVLPFDQLFYLKHGRYPSLEELKLFGLEPVALPEPTRTVEDDFKDITDEQNDGGNTEH